jgi:hypothetical protein
MATRGRKSAASLSVVVGSIDGRPQAPKDLTAAQRKVWTDTVATEASDVFRGEARLQMLRDYCRHAVEADRLAVVIDEFDMAWLASDDGVRRYDKLAGLRDREARAAADKATKLRLTNQSRYTPQAAATAGKNGGAARKPWEMAG